MLLRTLFSLVAAFGAVANAFSATLIPLDSSWKFFKGLAEASAPDATAWRQISFDDSTWQNSSAPFWYGDMQPAPGTALGDMRNQYISVFLRQKFFVASRADVSELQLQTLSDDGYIAWINGVEVARYNMPDGDVGFDGTSLPALVEPIPPETFVLENPSAYLVSGENVLAVHAFNASLNGSSDFVFNASLLSSVDDVAPSVTELIPPVAGVVRSLAQIEVHFSEPVLGVEAGDLLINGVPAAELLVFTPVQYVFAFPQPGPGIIQVSWKTDHGIHDLATSGNPFAGGNWSYTLNPNAKPPGVLISEFMAANNRTINDEDGESSDWIEIHNAAASPADLSGWFLTDDLSDLMKWQIPSISIPGHGYLLVFASDKNRTDSNARMHTNFKLSTEGEYLALVDANGEVVSEFAANYPAQQSDVSYGRDRANPETVGYFLTPTPGAPNSTTGPGFAPEMTFSRSGGTFTSSFALALSSPSSRAAIRYTLNGTVPTESAAVYSSPISISKTLQVRARAFETGLLPGPLRSETYVLLAANVVSFTSDLPVIVIHNLGGGSVPANEDKFAYLAIFEPVNGRTSLTNPPTLTTRAGINVRGSSTEGYPKSSFAVEWWDEFNRDIPLPALGLPADSDWVLYAPNNFEPVLIHNPFIYRLSNEMGRYAPRTRFVEVYLNTTGGALSSAHYNGLYVLEEKITRGSHRVDVPKLEAEHSAPPEMTGGYLLKIDRLDPSDGGFNGAGQNIAYVDPKEREIELPQRDAQEKYIRSYMSSFATALNGPNFTNMTTGYAQFVDVPSWIDHHILNVAAFNVDALRLSTYFYKQRNGKIFYGPIWDFDRALGSTDGRDSNPRVWSSDGGTDFFTYPWWGRLFRDPDFWQRWIDRYQELRETHLSMTNLNRLIDSLVSEVRQAQPREQKRWGVTPRGGSYNGEVNQMKSWLSRRINFMDTNLLAKPTLSLRGGRITGNSLLTISGPPGATVYCTLDGTDPRLRGGATAPTARTYSGPLELNVNARVVARARNPNHRNLTGGLNPPLSSTWSGPTTATFITQTPPLTITEIMYHPAPENGAISAAEAFEFIELKNVGFTPLNLPDFTLSGGIDFVLPDLLLAPGQLVVVVSDLAGFRSRYGNAPLVAGTYTGQLNNDSERLILEGPLKEPILDFDYRDSWFPITDGIGFSLVLANENRSLPLSDKLNWQPSARVGGSPGQDEPPFSAVPPPVLINEALTHTDPPQIDAVELYNPNHGPVDIGGWFLTDDFSTPKKFRIPDGPVILAGGFHTITQNDFDTDGATAFSLGSLGDEVYLFSADASGNLTGYYHGFDFGASENGVSFGRYVTSGGEEHFVAQSALTFNAPNAGPRVGPVVINEIMFSPQPSDANNNTIDEFVELQNIMDLSVPLFDPNAATNTWHITGGIDFVFPRNISLPPNARVLIVSFDPATDLAALAAFRARFGVDATTTIVGPSEGKLDNAGERIRLLKPDPPQAPPSPSPGLVPYVLADEVNYSSAFPWPVDANGTGKSLQRRTSSAYGDDPINWQAAQPTAGRTNPVQSNGDDDHDGLPNEWEIAYGLNPNDPGGNQGALGDPDGDRFTNLQEYNAGTDPRDPASALRINSVLPTVAGVKLGFRAAAGRSYSILYGDDLPTSHWRILEDVAPESLDRTVEIVDDAASSTRFYQLVTPAVP